MDIINNATPESPQSFPKIFAVSLGCPKNRVDTEYTVGSILHFFSQGQLVSDPSEADLIVVNTCGFIQDAVQESIDVILELAADKAENQKIIVLGCMVKRFPDELPKEIPEVDLWAGTFGSYRIDSILREIGFLHDRAPKNRIQDSRIISTPPWRAYLKVADGCSNRCTYCLIPKLRGSFSPQNFHQLVNEARHLDKAGVREITLVAQDLTAYRFGECDLSDLITTVSRETEIKWLRLMYLHPGKTSKELLNTIAKNSNVCRYLDIPIQHASNKILRRMGRSYSLSQIDTLVSNIRSILPDAALRTTVMVGFPGETQNDFDILKEMIKKWQFDHLGCFVYSDEPEAASNKMDNKVPKEVALSRQRELMEIQAEISMNKNKRFIGKTMEVLVEGTSNETDLLLVGRSEFHGPEIDGNVYINDGFCNAGEFVTVEITDSHVYDLVGKIVRPA